MSAPTMTPTLRDRIANALAEGEARETVVLAGHFAIFTAGGKAFDYLDDAAADASRVSSYTDMTSFTRSTWTAACDLLAKPELADARLLVLVDDLQFVRPALPDRGARERLGAALAADYLRRNSTLPGFHSRELESRGINTDRLVRNDDARWIFSERELREAAVVRIRAAAASGKHGARLIAGPDASRITINDPELGEHTIVHSGHTSCAGGYLELILRLRARGVRRLVALVPSRCLGPVTLGAALAKSFFGAADFEVVNLTS
jgi:hypothetical protein